MKRFLVLSLVLYYSFSLQAQLFVPSNLAGLSLWISADTVELNSGNVSTWYDRSVNNISLTQSNNFKQPVFNPLNPEMNNQPSILFDGIDDYLKGSFTSTMSTDSISLFLVQKTYASPNYAGSLVLVNNTNVTDHNSIDNLIAYLNIGGSINAYRNSNIIPYSNNFIISPTIFHITTDGTTLKTYMNNNFSNSLNIVGSFAFDDVIVGSRWDALSTNPMNCDMFEVILYSRLLTLSEQDQIFQYIYNKYAPPVNLGFDINTTYGFCDTTLDAGERFTNYLWSTGDTTQSVSINVAGIYWVEVKDVFGNISRDTIQLNYPIVATNSSGSALCYGTTQLLDTGFPKNGYSFQWQDNSTDSIFNIATAGQYWVKITDSLGCYQYSDTVTITVDNFPAIASLGNDTSLCSGNTIYLKSGASQAINYLWNDSSTNDSLAITATGPYWVTVSDINSCSKTDTINIAIAGSAPTGNFSNTSTCIGNSTSFNDLSIPPGGDVITNWLWNFGDPASGVNDTSSLQNPIHIYADTGSYTVNLLVTTNAGCGAVVAKTINVYPNPQINFTTSNLCENSNSQFIGQAVTFGYPITQWSWDFGDPSSGANNISGLQSPVHVFVSASTYTVQLIAQNIHGCADTANQNIVIGQLPVADFTSSVACKNSSVTFTDNSILPPSTSILATTWNFGDNGTSTLLNPSHIYSSNVNYNVTHTITASNGCKDTVIKTISVYPVPYAYFNANNICVNTLGDFNDLSVGLGGTIINWLWDFGSGDTSMTQNAKYAYTSVGNKNVKLVITTAQGCKDSITKTIVVNPLPVANYTYTPAIGTIPLVVNFTNTSSGALSYVWDFGDSTQSTLIDPSHTFLSAITYSISLTAKNSFGCENTVVKTISPLEQYLDVAILDVSVSTQNNFLNITAKIANTGNTDVTKMELYVNVQNGSMLKENWTGLLKAANIINYNINSSLYLGDEKKYDYVCVSAVLPNGVDDMISENNELCEALDESQFKVLDVYPNPSKDVLIIPFIIPAEKFLTITIYDINGKVVREAFSGYLTKGLQEVVINTLEMTSGIYACKIVHEDQTIIKKFIKH